MLHPKSPFHRLVWPKALLLLLLSFCAEGALPPEAQALLNTLPEKKLTLDAVVGRAMEASDSFKEVQAAAPSIPIAELQANAAFDWIVSASAGYEDDRSQALSPFQATSSIGYAFSAGLAKSFSTGTSVNLALTDTKVDLTFPPGGSTTRLLAFQPRVELSLVQKLWNNGFGYSSRRNKESGTLITAANESLLKAAIQDWVLQFAGVFYDAWNAQAALKTASQTVARRKKLLRITRQKLRRGTAEKPDLLQVQSAVLEDEIRYEQAAMNLGDKWRALVIGLKLDKAWLKIDPLEIPMDLDDPVTSELTACGPTKSLSAPPEKNYELDRAVSLADAAEQTLEVAKNLAKPDLDLVASISNNAVNSTQSDAFSEFFDFTGPAWQVGLEFTLPLGNSASKARIREAVSNQMLAEAKANMARDQLKLTWINACLDLHRQSDEYKKRVLAFNNQQERARLDQKRFSLGRINTTIVVASEDSAALAESLLQTSQVQRRLAAWKVRKLRGRIQEFVSNLKRQLSSYEEFR